MMTIKEEIKDIMDIHNHLNNGEVLLIDYNRLDDPMGDGKRYLEKKVAWSDMAKEDIYRLGYLDTEKWMDDLRYLGVPVYVRLNGFKIIDPTKREKPNRITSSVLYNVYVSRSVKNFIQGIMTKVGFAQMDVKALVAIIPIAIGLVVGVWYFMSGGLH